MPIDQLAFSDASYHVAGDKRHFDHLNITLPMNEVVLLDGVAGAGKSLLLQAMAGLLRPQTGAYLINGVDVSAMTFKDFLPYRLQIGYSFEHGGLMGDQTVLDNLVFPLQFHRLVDGAEAQRRAEVLIERLGLQAVRNEYPAELASSFKRRAVVARALMMQPELLLLDHPTTGLAHADRLEMVSLLTEQREQGLVKHIFLASSQEALIDNIVTYRLRVAGGRVCNIEE